MFIRPTVEELSVHVPEFTIINASDIVNNNYKHHGLNSETFVIFIRLSEELIPNFVAAIKSYI